MSDDPDLTNYRAKSKRWLKDFLKHKGPTEAHRAMILDVLDEIDAKEAKARRMDQRIERCITIGVALVAALITAVLSRYLGQK